MATWKITRNPNFRVTEDSVPPVRAPPASAPEPRGRAGAAAAETCEPKGLKYWLPGRVGGAWRPPMGEAAWPWCGFPHGLRVEGRCLAHLGFGGGSQCPCNQGPWVSDKIHAQRVAQERFCQEVAIAQGLRETPPECTGVISGSLSFGRWRLRGNQAFTAKRLECLAQLQNVGLNCLPPG